jgi:hypothetical protein
VLVETLLVFVNEKKGGEAGAGHPGESFVR